MDGISNEKKSIWIFVLIIILLTVTGIVIARRKKKVTGGEETENKLGTNYSNISNYVVPKM